MTDIHPLPPIILPEPLLEEVVTLFKALADPTRAQMIYLLTHGEHSVGELTDHVTVSQTAVSHHLSKLRAINLVSSRRDGKQIFYSIDDTHISGLFREALFHIDHIQKQQTDITAFMAANEP